MSESEQRATLTVALMAALADGTNDASERVALERLVGQGIAGGIGRSIGHQAASSGMAFASTWAIGKVAQQYYAGGRTLDAEKLRAAFAPTLDQARELGARYAGEIQQRARTIDLSNLPALIGRA